MSVLINSLRIVKEGDGIFMQLVHDSLQAGYVLLMIETFTFRVMHTSYQTRLMHDFHIIGTNDIV